MRIIGKFIDLTGQRFGKLTVIERTTDYITPKGTHCVMWLYKCDCGNYGKASAGSLRSHNTLSCGKCKNVYDLSGEYGIGYTSKGKRFYFDLEDYDKIKDYCWYIDSDGYVRNRDGILMHRIVTNCPDDLVPDHINGKKSRNDNRKTNLRIATRNQNTYNHDIYSNSTSKVSGVTWNKFHQKWLVRIGYNKQRIHIGYFDDFDKAVEARQIAEEKLYKEWRYKNAT